MRLIKRQRFATIRCYQHFFLARYFLHHHKENYGHISQGNPAFGTTDNFQQDVYSTDAVYPLVTYVILVRHA